MSRGKYIVIEGMDGAGKTTLARAVIEALLPQSIKISFPARTNAVGNLIRDVFDGIATVNHKAMLWLFVAEAVEMDPWIAEQRDAGFHVICDRHTCVSGLVYQTELHALEDVCMVTAAAHCAVPDRLFIVDVPIEISLTRRQVRQEKQNKLYEPDPGDILRINAQRARYLDIGMANGARMLDGTKPVEQLVQEVLDDPVWKE